MESTTRTFSERLKMLRTSKGLKQKDIASILKINPNTYCRYENGDRTPPPEILIKLAEIFNVSTDYLLGRNGKKQAESISASSDLSPPNDVVWIPVYGVIRAGEPIYADENLIDYVSIPRKWLNSGNYFGLKVVGDSMKDAGIHDGSIVIVRKQPVVDNGSIAVVLVKDTNEATVKRFYQEGNTVVLKPENPNYPLQIYKADEVMV